MLDLLVRERSLDPVVLVSETSVVLPLYPLFSHGVVLNLRLSSFPLFGCVLDLTEVSVLISLHALPAHRHVN